MWLHKVLYGSIQGFIVDKLLLNISVFDIYEMLQDVTVNCKMIKLCTNEPQIQEISNYSYPYCVCPAYFYLQKNIYNIEILIILLHKDMLKLVYI